MEQELKILKLQQDADRARQDYLFDEIASNDRLSREDAALQHVTGVAQRTIDRLQRAVAEKEAALARATRALTEARAEGMKAAADARAEAERLGEALQRANEQSIMQYRKVLADSDQRIAAGSGSKYSERTYEELLEIVGERERQLEALGNEKETLQAKYEVLEGRMAEQIAFKNGEIQRLISEIELEKARAPSKAMEATISKLRLQLGSKDRRMEQLRGAIKELESRLVDALQRGADDVMRESEVKSAANYAAQFAELNATIARLKSESARLRGGLDLKARDRAFEEERHALEAELQKSRVRGRRRPPLLYIVFNLSLQPFDLRRTCRAFCESTRVRCAAAAVDAVGKGALTLSRLLSFSNRAAFPHAICSGKQDMASRAVAELTDERRLTRDLKERLRLTRSGKAALADAAVAEQQTATAREDDLQKQVRMLQDSNNELRKRLAPADGAAGKADAAAAAAAATAAASAVPPNSAVERWEEGVKLRKRVETLKSKLEAKDRIIEAHLATIDKTKSKLEEMELDRTRREALRRGGAGDAGGAGPSMAALRDALETSERLHDENDKLRKRLVVEAEVKVAAAQAEAAAAAGRADAAEARAREALQAAGPQPQQLEDALAVRQLNPCAPHRTPTPLPECSTEFKCFSNLIILSPSPPLPLPRAGCAAVARPRRPRRPRPRRQRRRVPRASLRRRDARRQSREAAGGPGPALPGEGGSPWGGRGWYWPRGVGPRGVGLGAAAVGARGGE